MTKKNYLLKVRRSRKKYLFLYFLAIIVLFLIIYVTFFLNYKLSKFAWIASIAYIYFTAKFIEYERIKDWWGVTETSLVQSLGLFNKNVRQVDFSSISDLDLNQPLFKRILNYGNVNVRLFLNETSISIKDINNPDKFIEELQKIITKNRKKKDGIRDLQ